MTRYEICRDFAARVFERCLSKEMRGEPRDFAAAIREELEFERRYPSETSPQGDEEAQAVVPASVGTA